VAFEVGDLVDVRANKAHEWRAGTVQAVDGGCYTVELDTPVTANTWTGTTRQYGGDEPVSTVHIWKHVHDVATDDHIRVQGG
jgi:hypothetical protein